MQAAPPAACLGRVGDSELGICGIHHGLSPLARIRNGEGMPSIVRLSVQAGPHTLPASPTRGARALDGVVK